MKKIKKKIDDFMDVLPYLTLQLLPVIVLIMFLVFAYCVSISDLPDWFKFFLLR